MRNLHLKASINSTAVFRATNSDPKADDSTVFCLFECHVIGARFKKMMIPVWDRRVTRQPAWSASSKHEVVAALPLNSGAFGGFGSPQLLLFFLLISIFFLLAVEP